MDSEFEMYAESFKKGASRPGTLMSATGPTELFFTLRTTWQLPSVPVPDFACQTNGASTAILTKRYY